MYMTLEKLKNTENKNDGFFYRKLCSIFVIAAVAVFLFLLRYDVPLYGDDIGWLVLNNPDSGYLDEQVVNGECTLDLDYSFHGIWSRLKYGYSTWDGRVVSRLAVAAIRWIFSKPDEVSWILLSCYIMLLQILLLVFTVRSICGSMKKGMQAPAVILVTAVLLYLTPSYSYAYMTRLVMYVFTNIYVLSTVLYLALYGALQTVYRRFADAGQKAGRQDEGPELRTLAGINLLGLCAGLSHEAYGVIFGMVLLTQFVRFWLQNNRKISFRFLLMYIGYIVGFCICFFAPGNFNRAGQSHESTLYTVSLFTRLWNSIYIHAFVAYKVWIIPAVTIPVFLILVVVLLKKRILTLKDILSAVLGNLEWFLGFMMSVVTWGLVPRVLNYGMLAANVLLVIGVIRVLLTLGSAAAERFGIREKWMERMHRLLAGLTIIVVILLAAGRYPQITTAHQVADVWRENIHLARNAGLEEVMVPAYPEELDSRFYDLNAINDQSRYDKDAYCVVYGTHVVIGDRLR